MPLWILLVVIAQFLNAIVAIVDKFILTSKKVSQPIVYAFYVSILSAISLVVFILGFLPFDLGQIKFPNIYNISWPSLEIVIYSLISGFAFTGSLFFIYHAFKKADASDVVPVVGAVIAIFTFLLSFLTLGETLNENFLWGFILLVLGTALISRFRFDLKTFYYSLSAGFLFSVYYVCNKLLFEIYQFDQAFFWTRIAMIFVALTILFWPNMKKEIFSNTKDSAKKGGLILVLINNFIGGIAGLALLKAIEFGSVTIVQALGGLQFVFLLIISILIGKATPIDFGENYESNWVAFQKALAILIIVIGFGILFV